LGEYQAAHDGMVVTAANPSGANPWYWLLYWYDFTPNLGTGLRQSVWDAFAGLATYNLVLWTMPIELKGSFLVFGFLALFGAMRRRWLLSALFGPLPVLLAPKPPVAGEYYPLDFILGMALCDLWVLNQRTWRRTLSLGPALAVVAVALFALPPYLKPLSA